MGDPRSPTPPPPLDDQMYGFSINKRVSDRTLVYDKHLKDRHFVTLGKH